MLTEVFQVWTFGTFRGFFPFWLSTSFFGFLAQTFDQIDGF
jgi:hypothetical protein